MHRILAPAFRTEAYYPSGFSHRVNASLARLLAEVSGADPLSNHIMEFTRHPLAIQVTSI